MENQDPAPEETAAITVTKTKRPIPKLADLHHDVAIAFKNDELNLLLNQAPPVKWVKQHPMVKKEIVNAQGQKVKVPSEYLPIDMVELLLTRIFQVWNVEILREGALFNSVYVTIRLHYLDPVTGQMRFHDGTGAVGVQTDAGKSASDLGAIKQAAIQMALPSAKSYAIKDAAEHLGKLFGKDLNRQNAIDFTMAYQSPYVTQEEPAIAEEVDEKEIAPSAEDVQNFLSIIDDPKMPERVFITTESPKGFKKATFKAGVLKKIAENQLNKEGFNQYMKVITDELESEKGESNG